MTGPAAPPLGRILTATITPFGGDGEVDYGTFWRLCRHLVGSGTDGVVVADAAGESPTLSTIEKGALFHAAVDAIGGRADVIAAVGTSDTAESVRLARHAAEAGCDAVLVVTPPYSRPTQEGIRRHVLEVAEAAALPTVVLNDPRGAGCRIELDTLQRMTAEGTVTALVDVVEDVAWSTEVVTGLGGALPVYCDDVAAPHLLEYGAVGVYSLATHVVGPQIAELVTAVEKGDRDGVERLAAGLSSVFAALRIEPAPSVLKAIVADLWGEVGEPRLPLLPASPAAFDAISVAVAGAQGL